MGYHQLILNLPSSNSYCLSIDPNTNIGQVKSSLLGHLNNSQYNSIYFTTLGGKVLKEDEVLFNDQSTIEQLNVSIRLRGGKGGFGSMLRAQGGKMNAQKTTNFEACRDLQGRRIRTVNEAKKLEEELAALPQREKEKRERLEKKIEKALKERQPKKHLFDDNEFLDNREQVVEGVKSAVGDLLRKRHHSETSSSSTSITASSSSSSVNESNKKQKTQTSPVKKVVSMFDDDDDSEEEEASEEEASEEESTISIKGKEKIPTNISIKA